MSIIKTDVSIGIRAEQIIFIRYLKAYLLRSYMRNRAYHAMQLQDIIYLSINSRRYTSEGKDYIGVAVLYANRAGDDSGKFYIEECVRKAMAGITIHQLWNAFPRVLRGTSVIKRSESFAFPHLMKKEYNILFDPKLIDAPVTRYDIQRYVWNEIKNNYNGDLNRFAVKGSHVFACENCNVMLTLHDDDLQHIDYKCFRQIEKRANLKFDIKIIIKLTILYDDPDIEDDSIDGETDDERVSPFVYGKKKHDFYFSI